MKAICCADRFLARRSAGKMVPLRGAPRLPARGSAAGGPAAKRGRTPEAYCNAPYARVLPARNASSFRVFGRFFAFGVDGTN